MGEVEVVYGENGCGERMGRGAKGVGERGDLEGCCQNGVWEFEKANGNVAQDGTHKLYRHPKGLHVGLNGMR